MFKDNVVAHIAVLSDEALDLRAGVSGGRLEVPPDEAFFFPRKVLVSEAREGRPNERVTVLRRVEMDRLFCHPVFEEAFDGREVARPCDRLMLVR